jgi:RNase H-like domain found in reverse transcriptase
LDTDACESQIGCCLLQDQPEGGLLPVGYWSRSLQPAERNYSTSERECLAVVWAVLLLRPYLERTRFVVRTDHSALQWLLTISEPQGRLARWRIRLSEYDFEVKYKPGRCHQMADAMSRLPTEAYDESCIDDDIPCFALEEEWSDGVRSNEVG